MNYTLITGATSDIGIQIAKVLEQSGHSVLFTDLSEEALSAARQQMNEPQKHLILSLDLSQVEECKNTLTQYLTEKSIYISCAVFAAGVFGLKSIKMIDYGFLKRSFDIAVFSVYSLIQVLSSKKANGGVLKSLVFISSVNAKIGTKGYTIYAGVKSAMLGMMKSFAVELAPKVRVNAVLPGAVRTKTTAFIFDSQEGTNPRYLLGDGEPLDIANAIDFLLSEKSKWITGQEIIVDGGLTVN